MKKGMPQDRKPRGPKPVSIEVTERQQAILEEIVRRTTSIQRLVTRARIILKAAAGERNQHIADDLKVHVRRARRWRDRWRENSERLVEMEAEVSDKELRKVIEELLADEPRSGVRPTFSAEQVVHIVAIACEEPGQSGRPVTRWTPKELADEAIKRGIVESISPRTVGRFLKSGRSEAA